MLARGPGLRPGVARDREHSCSVVSSMQFALDFREVTCAGLFYSTNPARPTPTARHGQDGATQIPKTQRKEHRHMHRNRYQAAALVQNAAKTARIPIDTLPARLTHAPSPQIFIRACVPALLACPHTPSAPAGSPSLFRERGSSYPAGGSKGVSRKSGPLQERGLHIDIALPHRAPPLIAPPPALIISTSGAFMSMPSLARASSQRLCRSGRRRAARA